MPQPFRSSFNLPIAAGASRLHRQITGYPMNASVADSQSWRSNLKVSGIVVSRSGPQSSSTSLRDDFTRQASRTVKGVVTSIHADSTKTIHAGAWMQYEMLPAVQPHVDTDFLAVYDTNNSCVSAYTVHQTTQSNPSLELL